MANSTKSLEKWRHEIKVIGRKHFLQLYKELLGVSASSVPRLYKTVNLYGEWAVFEAIVSTSDKTLTGDPLNYVIAVAHAKWKEEQEAKDKSEEYDESIKTAIQETKEKSEALAEKLRKIKEIK